MRPIKVIETDLKELNTENARKRHALVEEALAVLTDKLENDKNLKEILEKLESSRDLTSVVG